ncbi:hypothetical protein BASA81_004081 [Batrachochytrium salamandrivorans]|nr:hypothetical protein BASA81_004081 [Batrachochytrium salamandrivorans]
MMGKKTQSQTLWQFVTTTRMGFVAFSCIFSVVLFWQGSELRKDHDNRLKKSLLVERKINARVEEILSKD